MAAGKGERWQPVRGRGSEPDNDLIWIRDLGAYAEAPEAWRLPGSEQVLHEPVAVIPCSTQ